MDNIVIYLDILWPAFCAGLLVLSTHVILGTEVIRRGIIFLDLAVAQIAGMGIIFAGIIGMEPHGWELQTVALISAIIAAVLLSSLEKLSNHAHEAIIGSVFVLAATGSLLLLSNNPQAGEHLKEILVGQILWVEWKQLLIPLVFTIVIIALWLIKPELFRTKVFYIIFALAITQSVQLVGVYLVFASLIMPALAMSIVKGKKAIVGGVLLGTVAYSVGLLASSLLDLPSGAVIVWVMAFISVLTYALAQRIKQAS